MNKVKNQLPSDSDQEVDVVSTQPINKLKAKKAAATTITTSETSTTTKVVTTATASSSPSASTTTATGIQNPETAPHEVSYSPVDDLLPSPAADLTRNPTSNRQPTQKLLDSLSSENSHLPNQQIYANNPTGTPDREDEVNELMEVDSNLSEENDSESDISAEDLSLVDSYSSSTDASIYNDNVDTANNNSLKLPLQVAAALNYGTNTNPSLEHSHPQQQTDNINPKPVYITSNIPFSELIEKLTNAIGSSNFVTKSTQRDIQVTCKDVATRRKLIEYIHANKMEYYTHMESRQTRVLIKGLNYSTPPIWLREELAKLGFNVVYATAEKNHRTGNPLDAFTAVLENTPNVNDIFQINKLGYQIVKIERSRSTEPLQCHNCQQFGHSKNGCNQLPACLKCAGSHHWKHCNKPSNQEAICVNCTKAHTANYRGCKVFKAALRAMNKAQQQQANRQGNRRNPPRTNQAPVTTSSMNPIQSRQPANVAAMQPTTSTQHRHTSAIDTSSMSLYQKRLLYRTQLFHQLQDEQRLQRHAPWNSRQPLQQQQHPTEPPLQPGKDQRRQQRSRRSEPTHTYPIRITTPDNLIASLQQDLDKISNYILQHDSLQPEIINNMSTLSNSLQTFFCALSDAVEKQNIANRLSSNGNCNYNNNSNNYPMEHAATGQFPPQPPQ